MITLKRSSVGNSIKQNGSVSPIGIMIFFYWKTENGVMHELLNFICICLNIAKIMIKNVPH